MEFDHAEHWQLPVAVNAERFIRFKIEYGKGHSGVLAFDNFPDLFI